MTLKEKNHSLHYCCSSSPLQFLVLHVILFVLPCDFAPDLVLSEPWSVLLTCAPVLCFAPSWFVYLYPACLFVLLQSRCIFVTVKFWVFRLVCFIYVFVYGLYRLSSCSCVLPPGTTRCMMKFGSANVVLMYRPFLISPTHSDVNTKEGNSITAGSDSGAGRVWFRW